jgi:sec-independent protein translocase protein TatA
MGSLGWSEILIILIIALIIFGPRKLPELGKSLGQSLAQFRKASEDFKRQWEEEVEMEKRRLESYTSFSEVERDNPASAHAAQPESYSAYDSTSLSNTETPAAPDHDKTVAREAKQDWM